MIFRSKKGMSPLIATVLLIAFAVALGAMIMNWSAGMEPGEGGMAAGCNDISLTATQNICYQDNALQIDLKNNGAGKIDGVTVHVTNIAEDLDLSQRVRDSSIIPGETIHRTVPTLHPGADAKIEVTPMIVVDGDLELCGDLGFIQQRLVNC